MLDPKQIRNFLFIVLAGLLLSIFSISSNNFEKTPVVSKQEQPKQKAVPVPVSKNKPEISGKHINVSTDLFDVVISENTGSVLSLKLKKYSNSGSELFLLSDTDKKKYQMFSDLHIGNIKPTFIAKQSNFVMDGQQLSVDLTWHGLGVKVIKRFTFYKNKYEVKLEHIVDNNSESTINLDLSAGLVRSQPPKSSSWLPGVTSFTGGAVWSFDKKYQKIAFSNFGKDLGSDFSWLAFSEHYFVSAIKPLTKNNSFSSSEQDQNYYLDFVAKDLSMPAKSSEVFPMELYFGPQIDKNMEQFADGLDRTLDYGIFWVICKPILSLVKYLYSFFANWGLAIIVTTVFIKLLFFPLSAAGFRSMGKMKKLAPQIEQLKISTGGDQQKFGQEMLALYKKEKVNPVGGCLPILLQIPVFIGLYYVLLNSVELRDASFALWIQDLAAPDPWFLLPIMMVGTMVVQQKLSPSPPDPVQAKVMMLMPYFMGLLFCQMPSGLVLYWVVNSSLSILQQWYITRSTA